MIIGATDNSLETSNTPEQYEDTISPMANFLALDTNIANRPSGWVQMEDFIAYRIWIDNTTDALMTVTITSPSGQTKNLYITSGSNKTYTNNSAEEGTYRLSFHTYASTLSGTVRVRVSTTPLL